MSKDRPYKDWTSDSSLISHYFATFDPEVQRELEIRGRERTENAVSRESIRAIELDESRRPFAPALN